MDRYERMQLIALLSVLVMCAHGDHFQHEVYAHPEATPAERHAIWRRLEARYRPWRNWGDLAYPAMGGAWQDTLHYYLVPVSCLDYALAPCCALQYWTWSQRDPRGALDGYMALCARGGSAPFGGLVRSAGLVSPFEPGALAESMRAVEAALAG